MWQRLTDEARRAVFYTNEEAQNAGNGLVETEHLLVGILQEDEFRAAVILAGMGVSAERLREDVKRRLPPAAPEPREDMTLTARCRRTLDLAFEEARQLGHEHIGTEHLLLGIVRQGDGIAGVVLKEFGVEASALRTALGNAPPT